MTPELAPATCGGKWVHITARAPQSVCAPESLLAAAMRSLGFIPHPAPRIAFNVFTDETGVFWRWTLSEKSADGLYEAGQLKKWWNDPAWRAANPMDEITILFNGLRTLAMQAGEIRAAIPHLVVRNGSKEAHIPANASPARKAHLLGKLRGEIPMDAVFEEPARDGAPSTKD